MERRRLAEGLPHVGVLGLGTVKLGRTEALKYPRPFDLPDDATARRLLDAARDLGINLLDTAPAYGSAEERLGGLLRGTRDTWVLATKAGETFADGASSFDFRPDAIRRSVEESLTRLRTDRLDVVLLHSDGNDEESLLRRGALDALRELQAEGKIVAVGASTKQPEGGLRAVELCDVVMLTCNPGHDGDDEAIRRAGARGVGVLVKKALASGHLGSFAPPGVDPVEHAMTHVLARSGVTSIVVGTLDPLHLAHDAQAVERAVAALRQDAT